MEVHHHPEVEKKGFKEYLLEGLMIFIAVTLGFFAESIREHVADSSKETEYMRSMVQDLKADTAWLNKSITLFGAIYTKLDTMLICLKSDDPDPAVINRVVSDEFWLYTGYYYNNRTVQQLKNSGGFRLVHDTAVSAGILKYDNFQSAIMITQYTDLKNTMYAYKDIEARAIHYKELKPSNNNGFNPADFVVGSQPYLTHDKELVDYYYNRLFIHDRLCQTFLRNIKFAKGEAAELIALIQSRYHLE